MSWARIDDEAWYHGKFQDLQAEGVEGMAAIGLWAMAISLTGQKKFPQITLAEATMLCGGDRDLALRCFVLLHDTCLAEVPSCFSTLDESLASKRPSIIIHNWEKYRSKDEARVIAGRKGGRKSAEIRSQKSKQSSSKAEAKPKHPPSNPPTPVPVPVPGPDPVPEEVATSSPWPESISSVADFELAIADWKWAVGGLSPTMRKRVKRITDAGGISRQEYQYAREKTAGKTKPIPYFLTVVEGERQSAAEETSDSPPPRKKTTVAGFQEFVDDINDH